MEASLFLIHPNDLETLIIEADNSQAVLESNFILQSLYLGQTWDSVNHALNVDQQSSTPLQYAIQAEHPLSERIDHPETVHYNTVVRVSEIQQQLQQLSVDELKKRYQFDVVHTAPAELAQELYLAELKLIYLQLQDFYRDAAKQNLAVISVIQKKIQPEKLI
ncbi:DUF1877 family protein [Acinetobacter sp. ANC 3813]|uniref:DUF1877 family protein n=1 Tax=Acinetobacter sp. ANC 3813 TaxID=1977873 RepID=UPI000A3450A5|nr:DUF1877 family protein [Acinetobacter sp. ANC 3813]OTG92266.1 hypothetical protein B9T34_02735 [Acinetobacter sp. ANC 3813]